MKSDYEEMKQEAIADCQAGRYDRAESTLKSLLGVLEGQGVDEVISKTRTVDCSDECGSPFLQWRKLIQERVPVFLVVALFGLVTSCDNSERLSRDKGPASKADSPATCKTVYVTLSAATNAEIAVDGPAYNSEFELPLLECDLTSKADPFESTMNIAVFSGTIYAEAAMAGSIRSNFLSQIRAVVIRRYLRSYAGFGYTGSGNASNTTMRALIFSWPEGKLLVATNFYGIALRKEKIEYLDVSGPPAVNGDGEADVEFTTWLLREHPGLVALKSLFYDRDPEVDQLGLIVPRHRIERLEKAEREEHALETALATMTNGQGPFEMLLPQPFSNDRVIILFELHGFTVDDLEDRPKGRLYRFHRSGKGK